MLGDLPYCSDALEPNLSQTTIRFHQAQHHDRAMPTLGSLVHEVQPTEFVCERIIANTSGEENLRLRMIFESAVQA